MLIRELKPRLNLLSLGLYSNPRRGNKSILNSTRGSNFWRKKSKGNSSISLPKIARPLNQIKQIKSLFKTARQRGKRDNQRLSVKIVKPQNIKKKKKVKRRNFETRSRKNSFLSRMEYSSTKSNRSQRSIQLEEIENTNPKENSIIIEEEKEIEDSTKYSDAKKKQPLVLPSILNKNPHMKKGTKKRISFQNQNQPTYTYSLKFERSKLGIMSTRVIKEQVNKIRKKCQSIASNFSEKDDDDMVSTTDTPQKRVKFIQKVAKSPKVNRNHRYSNNQRLLSTLNKSPNKNPRKKKMRRSLNIRPLRK
ncbi:unnamed protein product [Moneuplotes crassus]|uniref:Uncharacterized protein n=1 Tax=Euplotes crassus TaxID=5936 RepID=A0AAD1XKQ1_EUPCR|nr:unnamed protein product [Moneuplotes crassus]